MMQAPVVKLLLCNLHDSVRRLQAAVTFKRGREYGAGSESMDMMRNVSGEIHARVGSADNDAKTLDNGKLYAP